MKNILKALLWSLIIMVVGFVLRGFWIQEKNMDDIMNLRKNELDSFYKQLRNNSKRDSLLLLQMNKSSHWEYSSDGINWRELDTAKYKYIRKKGVLNYQ